MSKENRRVPKLRFPGFTEDWEQRKLGSIGSTYTGLSGKTKEDFGHGEAQYITYLNVFQNTISNITMTDKVEIDTTQTEVKYGDVLFTTSSETPEEVGMSSVWLGDTPNTYLNSFCFGFRPKQKIDLYFLGYSLRAPYMRDKIKILAQGISRYNISKNKVMELEISLPNNEEQNLLGNFLRHIDLIITLHQRKLNNLKLKKKALLQKLFPKNGERYPELRFPGFTDAWEQRKADYIFKSVTEKGYPELPVLSASQELGMVYRNQNGIDIQHDKKNESSYKRVSPGQFVIHLRSFQGGFAYSEVKGITSPAYTVMSFKNSSEQYGLFWKYVFKSETFIKRLETITYGIRDGRNISFSDFKSLMLQYPSFLEQELIGDLIAIIESGITLHQRKLDHLQLQKKALLQQMFV